MRHHYWSNMVLATSSLLITKENFNVAYLITVGLFRLSIWELLSLCMGIQSNALLHLHILRLLIKPCPELEGEGAVKRIEKISNKIASLLRRDIPDAADRDYLIAALKDIKADTSFTRTSVTYSDDIKAIFNKYGVKFE